MQPSPDRPSPTSRPILIATRHAPLRTRRSRLATTGLPVSRHRHGNVVGLRRRTDKFLHGAEHAVEQAMRAGKLVPAQREWAIAYCAADPRGFAAFTARQPALLAGELNLGGDPRAPLPPERARGKNLPGCSSRQSTAHSTQPHGGPRGRCSRRMSKNDTYYRVIIPLRLLYAPPMLVAVRAHNLFIARNQYPK